MNACDRAEHVALYVGGDLAPAESAAVQRHATECAECRALLADLMVDAALLRAPVELPAAAFSDVRSAVSTRLQSFRHYLWWPAAAAAAAALATLAWYTQEVNRPLDGLDIVVSAPAAPRVALPQPATAEVSQRRPTIRHRHDPAALAMALRAMLPPVNAAPAASSSPVLITTQTEDPNVVIILIPETKGDMHE